MDVSVAKLDLTDEDLPDEDSLQDLLGRINRHCHHKAAKADA
jgi:hypothetical protein